MAKLQYTSFIRSNMIKLLEINAIAQDVEEVSLWRNIETGLHVGNVGLPNLPIMNSQRGLVRNNNPNLQNFVFPSL
jgi:hypothetical protein